MPVRPPDTGDAVFLEALRGGSDQAFNGLMARWKGPLHAFAHRYVQNRADAEDLVAEVFVRLYQHRAALRPDSNLSAWLFTALSRLCLNHQRWRRRHPASSLEAAKEDESHAGGGLADPSAGPVERAECGERVRAVREAIAELPHDMKVTLLLHQYEGLSHAEIGAILGCAPKGVETRLYRARQLLRARLAPYLDGEVAAGSVNPIRAAAG